MSKYQYNCVVNVFQAQLVQLHKGNYKEARCELRARLGGQTGPAAQQSDPFRIREMVMWLILHVSKARSIQEGASFGLKARNSVCNQTSVVGVGSVF